MARVGRRLMGLVSWAALVATVVVLSAMVVVPRLVGGTAYAVLSGSMRPGLPEGALVVTKPVEPEQIGVGDVITYQLHSGRPTVVTHRVVESSAGLSTAGEPRWRTQGDANDVVDAAWVRPVQIRGELWYALPYLGRVHTWIDPAQRRGATYAASGGLLAYAAWMLVTSRRDRAARNGTARNGTARTAPARTAPARRAAR